MTDLPIFGPTTINKTLRSYLYWQYSDDDSLQAFVEAYNAYTQAYVDWFNALNLPIYTQAPISGGALDWVAAGIYGLTRPALPSGRAQAIGAYNTLLFNTALPYNGWHVFGPTDYTVTSDDTFRRIMTWALYKGDGKYFNIRWLKRRIMRFLIGQDGTAPNIDQTYQISVSLVGTQVNITILSGVRTVTGGNLYNRALFNAAIPFNGMLSTFRRFTALAQANTLKSAIDAGVLELPFQFQYVVVVE